MSYAGVPFRNKDNTPSILRNNGLVSSKPVIVDSSNPNDTRKISVLKNPDGAPLLPWPKNRTVPKDFKFPLQNFLKIVIGVNGTGFGKYYYPPKENPLQN